MRIVGKRWVVAVAAFALVGCGSSDGPTDSQEITISAAASLSESFAAINDAFLVEHPEVRVSINFGSSGQLSTQIQQGAPADVAAFADETPMTALEQRGLLAGPPEIFAFNRLAIVTKPGNPQRIRSLSDLSDAGTIALCAETAPCGSFAAQILATAGVVVPESSVTRGQNVKATLAAVAEGDADAAIVYFTDASAAGGSVATVSIPEDANLTVAYPIAIVSGSTNGELAAEFKQFVLGDVGQATLRDAGFLTP